MPHNIKPWEELSRKVVFSKYSRVIEKVIYRFPAGQERDFYLKKEGNAVCTLALTNNREVILVKQYRPGPKKILLELPGGGMEEGEKPIEAAARELLEETGYKGKMHLVTGAWDCAYSTRYRYCFVATDCEKVAEPKNDPNEPVEVELISLEDFKAHIRSGELTDVDVAYLGLDYLGLL